MRQDFVYIIKNSIISLFIVLFSMIFTFMKVYQIKFTNALMMLKECDIYTLTYCFELILLMIVLFELWKILIDAIDLNYQKYVIIACSITMFIIIFLPIDLLFKLIAAFFIVVCILRIAYQFVKNK